MKKHIETILLLLFILLAFGIAGHFDMEAEEAMSHVSVSK